MSEETNQIELSIDQCKEKIELAVVLRRLQKNADFKKIFTDTYLSAYAIKLVKRKVMLGEMQNETNQKYIDGQLAAIGHIEQYMHFILQEGSLAVGQIQGHEAELDLVHEEEANA